MTHLMVDAAFPPTPALWINDMNTIGADGGFVYVMGDFLHYTPAHITLARAAGKTVIPIVVPGNTGPSFGTVHASLLAYGFTSGPVVVDLEQFSEPPDSWLTALATYLAVFGYVVDRYGTSSELGRYSPENEDWVAQWVRTGILNPLPTLPAGRHAWQFVDDVSVNGNQYDVSVVDSSFAGDDDMFDATDKAFLNDVHQGIGTLTSFVEGQPPPLAFAIKDQVDAIKTSVDSVSAAVAAVSNAPASAQAIAEALAANAEFVAALARAVVQEQGKAMQGAP